MGGMLDVAMEFEETLRGALLDETVQNDLLQGEMLSGRTLQEETLYHKTVMGKVASMAETLGGETAHCLHHMMAMSHWETLMADIMLGDDMPCNSNAKRVDIVG